MTAENRKRLRVLRVVVQPHFVLDDGEVLEELPPHSLTLKPDEIETFFSDQWPTLLADLEEKFSEAGD